MTGQAPEWWEAYRQKITECDREMETIRKELGNPSVPPGGAPGGEPGRGLMGPVKLARERVPGKNAPVIEGCQELLARICGGHDATRIPGLGVHLVLPLISEVGADRTCWPTEKHFTSWLGLAGGGQQRGQRQGSVQAHRNGAGRMFGAAARSLAQSVDKALGGFYRRLRGRIGGLAAKVALARKLARLFYRWLR